MDFDGAGGVAQPGTSDVAATTPSDWPHVMRQWTIPMPNDGDLADLLADWIPDETLRNRVLSRFEASRWVKTPEERRSLLAFAICSTPTSTLPNGQSRPAPPASQRTAR